MRRSMLRASTVMLASLALWFPQAIGDDRQQRFEIGPLLSEKDQFFDISAALLNEPRNAMEWQRGVTLYARLYGSKPAAAQAFESRDMDFLARDYISAFDGALSGIAKIRLFSQLDMDPGGAVIHYPGGQQVILPSPQAFRFHDASIRLTGHEMLGRAQPATLAGGYRASTRGDCPFSDGQLTIQQDRFLIEGSRDGSLLFWGAVGESKVFIEAAEIKYAKATAYEGRQGAMIEFPDEVSDLYSAAVDGPELEFTGAFFGKCRITLTLLAEDGDAMLPEPSRIQIAEKRMLDEGTDADGRPFEKRDSPGVTLRLDEIDRTFDEAGGLEVRYRLIANGFPADKQYSLWNVRPVNEASKIMDELLVDASGAVVIKSIKPDVSLEKLPMPLSDFTFVAFQHQSGEAYRVFLQSKDGETRATARAFPVPLEDRDGDCRLHLELKYPSRTGFAAFASGFRPNAALEIESVSIENALRSLDFADQNGEFSAYVFPEILGEPNGHARYRIRSDTCTVALSYAWGVGPS